MYHRNAASVMVPARSLHLRESVAPTMAIRVLKAVTCSTGSPLPSKVERWGSLKLSGTGAFQISVDKGLGSGSTGSPW